MKTSFLIACLGLLYFISLASYGQESSATDQRARNVRTDWFLSGRVAPRGQSGADFRERAHQFRLQATDSRRVFSQQTSVVAGGEGWVPLGPAPLASDASGFGLHDYGWVSGRATSVTIDRSDITGNTVYLGAAYGGVWKSTNASTPLAADVIWIPLFDDQPTLAVGAMAVQPGSSRVILVGTGESNSSTDSYYGLGIFRSTDAGANWSQVPSSSDGHSFKGLGFSQIAFSSANTSLVVAATGAAPQGSMDGLDSRTNRGIYVSSNSGQTWQWSSIKDGSTVITPSSVTSVAYDAAAHKFFAAIRRHGIYSSTDGFNWSRLASQPGAASGPGALTSTICPPDAATNSYACPIYRAQIAVVPGRDEVYVWFVDLPANQGPTIDRGIWRSVNGGPWIQISDAGFTLCGDSSGCGADSGDYALTLNAVPNGAIATDVYAGATNLFKCSLNDTSTTSCSGGAWLNLSHAYGCSEIAKIHPHQHAADFIISSGKAIGYFANDGGIYRTPDGYLGLIAGVNGSCSGSNHFDSLNETIGSLTQFVSLAQDPVDANTLLGGAQGNGFPATNQATSSSEFVNVMSGDGGTVGMVPGSTRWLGSTGDLPPSGLNISACDSGVDCRMGNFTTLLSSVDLAGDDGAYYVPFAFDPRATSQLLLGTCRIWRAAVDGSSVSQLSNNFDNGSGNCSGSEANLVRAIAAGGLAGDHGFSNVIYATTYGSGPLAASSPAGGRIFVSTNADTATSTFRDMTGSLNPEQYPISSVAIDSSDATGRTAFISVMGFGVPHVFKTTDAGTTWQVFGNLAKGLPDTPANSVLVDSEAAQVYLGTDGGVFVSSTTTPSWGEVGPASGSGHLPNVPVTTLLLFRPDAKNKRLRAATYGRGVWEYVLAAAQDFRVAFNPNILTVFAGQEARFSGTLSANYGYGSSVNLACIAAEHLSTCKPTPSQIVPISEGIPVNVIASAAPGSYPFTLRASGADTDSTTHDSALTLKVVDFGLSNASPATITVTKAGTSTPATFSVSASGPFDRTVTLNCASGLPSGAACLFSPRATVTPSDSHPKP